MRTRVTLFLVIGIAIGIAVTQTRDHDPEPADGISSGEALSVSEVAYEADNQPPSAEPRGGRALGASPSEVMITDAYVDATIPPFDRWIDWLQSSEEISRLVRALTFAPFPSARTAFAGSELEVRHPVWIAAERTRRPVGTVMDITPQWVTIATGDGSLSVQTIRLRGTELRAAEALGEVGCSIGSMLYAKPWAKNKAA